MRTKIVQGQRSWRVAAPGVAAFVTETGGHLGPVTFQLPGRKVAPLSVAPWAEEKSTRSLPPILRALRGDFFCLPFGGNATVYQGERHPPHGETANAQWKFEAAQLGHLHLSLRPKVRRGRVDKHIFLRAGHTMVYQQHIISGMRGPMSLGHHAIVKFPDSPGSGVISTSRFIHGQVFPDWFERPENRGYQALQPGATFKSLRAVPQLTGGLADLSRYPARRGFEDLVQLVADPKLTLGWTAVTFPNERYVWFALRDPRVLTGTVLWITNGGRHRPPWNSRHVNVLGLEEVTANFDYGVAESARANPLKRRGYVTALELNPDKPLVVNYIFGVADIPGGFARVADIVPVVGGVELRPPKGQPVRAAVDWNFLATRAGV